MALFATLTMAGTVAATALAQRTYRSDAKVLVRVGRENTTVDATATLGQTPLVAVPTAREAELNSVLEVLGSRTLVERVVDSVGVAAVTGNAPPEPRQDDRHEGPGPQATREERYRAIVMIQQMIKLEAVKRSNVIGVSCEAGSPETAQAIVDRLIDFSLDQHMSLNRTPGAYKFLSEQAARLDERVRLTEEELRNLKDQTGLISPEGQRQVLVTRLGRLEDELLLTVAGLKTAEAEVASLEKQLRGVPRTQVTGTTQGVPNPAADQMRAQLYTLQLKELELLARHPEEHPEVKLIRRQTAAAKRVLADEPTTREQVTAGPNRVHEDLHQALLKQQTQVAALQTRHTALQRQLAAEANNLKAFTANEIRIIRVQRRLELETAQYRKYAENLEQGQIDQALQSERISNISIVQPGTCDPKPIRPRWSTSLGLGVLLAVSGSIGLAFLAEYRSALLISARAQPLEEVPRFETDG